MTYEEAVRYLLTLGRELASPSHARAAKFDLANIAALAQRMGHPERAYPSAHIAGTNGKGSTAAMLESILRAAGLRAGLFTSPHLERINERLRLSGEDITDAEFAASFTRLRAIIEELMASGHLAAHPTYFECLTAMAFDWFAHADSFGARSPAEFGVFEVGMGGRLDSTNILQPEVAVITQIAFDHENFLGHSMGEIASEKAGIIKPSGCVVSAAEHPRAREVISRRAASLGAQLEELDTAWRIESLTSSEGCYRAVVASMNGSAPIELAVALPGRFQVRNALAAAAAARALARRGYSIEDAAIVQGIATARWPGRLERLGEHPAVFLDGTHNPAGARELAAFWDEHFAGRRIFLVYGSVRDKAVDEIAGLLFPRAAAVILTEPRLSRAISARALADLTRHLAARVEIVPVAEMALARALDLAAPDDAVFASGSLYLAGDLRRWWRERNVPPAPTLEARSAPASQPSV